MATKVRATVLVVETTAKAEQLGFKANECYRCEFLEPDYEGQDGNFFDQVETGRNNWIPLSILVRSGATIIYKINENEYASTML